MKYHMNNQADTMNPWQVDDPMDLPSPVGIVGLSEFDHDRLRWLKNGLGIDGYNHDHTNDKEFVS